MSNPVGDLRAYFEDLAGRWNSFQPPDRGELLRRLLAPFAPLLNASRAILEVGTGTGALIPCLRERAPGARLVSIDLAGQMLRRARQRCPDAAVVQADAHRPPFATPGFDLVVCHNSFPHFADKPAALCSLARLLRPGGHLLILHDLSREKVNAIHSSGGAAIQNDLLPPGEETGHMLMQAGFVAVQVEDSVDRYVVAGRQDLEHHSYLRAALRFLHLLSPAAGRRWKRSPPSRPDPAQPPGRRPPAEQQRGRRRRR